MVNFIKKHFDLIGYIALAIFFVVLNYNLYINMDMLLDSDMASEMIYAKLLADEKTLISPSWYFSTIIETVNIPLVFAPLFLITNNWHLIRIIGIIILDILLFLSFYYVCKQLNIKHISWIAFLMLGAVSYDYFYYVLRGSYYLPIIAMAFLSIGLVIDVCKNSRIISFKTLLLVIISILSGLGGIRQIAQCYVCIFGASLLILIIKQYKNILNKTLNKKEDSFKILIISTISLFSSFAGFLINKLLLETRYTFSSIFKINFKLASFSRILDIAYDWTTLFGYETGSVIKTIIAIILILITIYCCLYICKKTKDTYDLWIVILYVCINIVTTCIFLFTDMMMAARYYLLSHACLVFILGIYLKNKDLTMYIGCLIVSVVSVLLTISNFNVCLRKIDNKDLINIKNELLKQECYNGYGSFWYANVFTELSDGKIEAWSYHSKINDEENVDVDNLYKWLQKKEHFSSLPIGKTFLVLSDIEQENVNFVEDVSNKIYYQGNRAILYIFDDCNELFNALGVE